MSDPGFDYQTMKGFSPFSFRLKVGSENKYCDSEPQNIYKCFLSGQAKACIQILPFYYCWKDHH
jgi:hypothetical protein